MLFSQIYQFSRGCETGSFLTLVLSFLTTGVFVGVWMRWGPPRIWDYLVSLSLVHFAISCLAMLQFPTDWAWWVTIILATGGAMLIAYGTRRMLNGRKIDPQAAGDTAKAPAESSV